jgi:hypothetical protein
VGEKHIAAALLADFLQYSKMEKFVSFFRRSSHSYVVWLMVLDHYFNSKKLSVENIEKEMHHMVSRKTLFSFLDDAVQNNFLIKTHDPEDKRRTLLTPTKVTLDEFKTWSATLTAALKK